MGKMKCILIDHKRGGVMPYQSEVEDVLAIARIIASASGRCANSKYRFQPPHPSETETLFAAYALHMAKLHDVELEDMFNEMKDEYGQVRVDFAEWVAEHGVQGWLNGN
jgi:hypothetical protein